LEASYGLSKLYYAVLSDEGYSAPVHIPGAVKINLNPVVRSIKFTGLDGEEKEPYTFFDGYDGTIEFAGLTEDFLRDVLGYTVSGGIIVESADSFAAPVCAVMFETAGNFLRHKYYCCSFARPSFSAETTAESVKIDTAVLSVKIRKHSVTKEIKRIAASADSAYTDWFKAV